MHHCTICKLRSWFSPLSSSLNLPNLSGHFAIHGELKFHLCWSDERSKAGPNPRAGRIGSAAHELKTVPGEIKVKLFGNHREVGNHWEWFSFQGTSLQVKQIWVVPVRFSSKAILGKIGVGWTNWKARLIHIFSITLCLLAQRFPKSFAKPRFLASFGLDGYFLRSIYGPSMVGCSKTVIGFLSSFFDLFLKFFRNLSNTKVTKMKEAPKRWENMWDMDSKLFQVKLHKFRIDQSSFNFLPVLIQLCWAWSPSLFPVAAKALLIPWFRVLRVKPVPSINLT